MLNESDRTDLEFLESGSNRVDLNIFFSNRIESELNLFYFFRSLMHSSTSHSVQSWRVSLRSLAHRSVLLQTIKDKINATPIFDRYFH